MVQVKATFISCFQSSVFSIVEVVLTVQVRYSL